MSAEADQAKAPGTNPGLASGLSDLAGGLSGLLLSRIELAALELSEVRDNLVRLLLVGALGMFVLWLAVACWTALAVVLAWDTLGWGALLVAALIHTLLAWVAFSRARALLARGGLSMSATLLELRKDRDLLLFHRKGE